MADLEPVGNASAVVPQKEKKFSLRGLLRSSSADDRSEGVPSAPKEDAGPDSPRALDDSGSDTAFEERLCDSVRLVEVEDGDVVVFEGNEDKRVYQILRGVIEVSGAVVKLPYKLRAGEMFGEESFLDDVPSDVTATAVENCIVATIDPKALREVMGSDKTVFSACFFRRLCESYASRILQGSDLTTTEAK